MRMRFVTALIITVLAGGGYFYYVAGSICPAPLTYRLGELDSRFSLTQEEAKLAIARAESLWEDATGRNLFTYAEEGTLVVNFVFDERQQFANAEDLFKEKLDVAETMNDEMRDTYEALVNKYNTLRLTYQQNATTYEQKLNAYNAEVEKYNDRGGAPADTYARLAEQKRLLSVEQNALSAQANTLNALVSEINSVGEKANRVISTYNQGVNVYNETFGKPREFTQGDYSSGVIHIYTFEDLDELTLVLVHELGHALSLSHVENKASVMHYLLGGQSATLAVTAEDLAEFERVCGQKSVIERLKMAIMEAQRQLDAIVKGTPVL